MKSQFNVHKFNTQQWNTETPHIVILNDGFSLSDDKDVQYNHIVTDFVFSTDSAGSEFTETVREDEIKLSDWLTIKRTNKPNWKD